MNTGVTVKSATGVDLALRVAGPGARSYAFVIDWHIRLLLSLTLFVGLSFLVLGAVRLPDGQSDDMGLYLYLVIALPGAVYGLYHPVLEVLTRGRTPGKRLAGIRIVTEDAQTPGVLAILIRNVLRLIDGLPIAYGIGLVAAHVTRNAVRIGDLAAGTVLVYDRDDRGRHKRGTQLSPEVVARHGVALAEVAQDLLDRWDELESGQVSVMAIRLLALLAPEAVPSADRGTLRQQIVTALSGADPSAAQS